MNTICQHDATELPVKTLKNAVSVLAMYHDELARIGRTAVSWGTSTDPKEEERNLKAAEALRKYLAIIKGE